MTDQIDDILRNSTEVMTELACKAKEAVNAGESRRSFFSKTAKIAGATALGAAGAGLLQPIAARAATNTTNADTVADILNIAATAEALATTFYYYALEAGSSLPDVNSTANQNYFQAAVTEEFEHLVTLQRLGGKNSYTKFYFPTNMFTDEKVFFPTALLLEEFFISAYLAAALDLSGAVSSNITTADPYALGFAVQVMGVECEHRALLGVAANQNPPNNRVYEAALVKSVRGAASALVPFLTGGDGYTGPFRLPTPSKVNAVASPYGFSFFKKEIIV